MSGSYHYLVTVSKPSYSLDVVHEVHERGVGPERLEDLSLVEQGVDQVGVVVEAVRQTRVHYLQHHLLEAGAKGASRKFDSSRRLYRKTFRSDGFVGLYRGFVISCVGIVVYRGFYFGLYDTLKPMLLGEDAGVILSFLLGYGVTISAGVIKICTPRKYGHPGVTIFT